MKPDKAIQFCAQTLRNADYGRYLACLYLNDDLRSAGFALHAFDSEIAGICHKITDPVAGEIRIQWWRDVVNCRQPATGNPLAQALMKIVTRHNLPIAIIDRYLNARIFDLYHDPMPDKFAFESYLGETRSTLLHLLTLCDEGSKITDESNAKTIADACGHGGVFIGSVELLNALPFSHAAGRQYFPDDLSKHKLFDPIDQHKTLDSQWIGDIANFAQHHYQHARAAINKLPIPMQPIFLPLAPAKASLKNLQRNSVSLAKPARQISLISLHWQLWNAARKINAP